MLGQLGSLGGGVAPWGPMGVDGLLALVPWALAMAAGGLGMVDGPVPAKGGAGGSEGPDGESMSTDKQMIRAVKAGDATAYRGLVEKYQQRIYHVIYGMVRNQEDARDLTQDTFVKAFRNLEGFREDARFYTWVYRIAMNLTIDFTRRRARAPVSAGAEADVAERDADRGIEDTRRDDSPRKQLERKQLHTAILDAIESLPEVHRQVVLLREVEGLSYKEIAEVLEIKEGTVMSRLFYARRKLQEQLADFRGQA